MKLSMNFKEVMVVLFNGGFICRRQYFGGPVHYEVFLPCHIRSGQSVGFVSDDVMWNLWNSGFLTFYKGSEFLHLGFSTAYYYFARPSLFDLDESCFPGLKDYLSGLEVPANDSF